MRALVLFGLALTAALPCQAQRVDVAPWMTGAQLLQLLTLPAGAKNGLDLTPGQYDAAERGRAYVEGVHDATEGKTWCYSERYHPGPGALMGDVIGGLRALPSEQLKRNASALIEEIWARKWPCGERRKSQ